MQQAWGIYGGSFDPPHLAHLMVARRAKQALGLQRVVWIPSGTPPHKKNLQTDGPHRLAMTRLLVQQEEGFAVSDMEVASGHVDYTVVTLRRLVQAHPGVKFTFIMGGDSLLYLDKWYCWQEICALARIAAVYRPGASLAAHEQKAVYLRAAGPADVVLLECEGMDISSTDIRCRAAQGQSLAGLVPPQVEEYICSHHLYEKGAEYGR